MYLEEMQIYKELQNIIENNTLPFNELVSQYCGKIEEFDQLLYSDIQYKNILVTFYQNKKTKEIFISNVFDML